MADPCAPPRGCTYSRNMNQEYPRKCTVCGAREPHRVVGHIASGQAHIAPDAAATLDEMFGDAVIDAKGNVELTEGVETLTGVRAKAYREYEAALKEIRDTEQAFKAAQVRYRDALQALNAAALA